ncbi:MAG: sugar ABC transporter permease [Clostridia bacterium]|nr:sugar ABC transporter permease [Clostridia bacterium]
MTGKKQRILRTNVAAWSFLLPFLALYTLFIIYPVFKAGYMSAFKWNLMGKRGFEGLSNYQKLLGDKYFWGALLNTGKFMLYSTPTIMLSSLTLALLANRHTRFTRFYRSAYFLPHLLSVSIVASITRYMAQPYGQGFISTMLHTLGIKTELFFLTDPHLVWVTLVVATMWWTQGYNFLIYTAALQDIPEVLYEAASIDGASGSQQLFHITLPLLSKTTVMILMLQMIASAKLFGQVWMITEGGPGWDTRTIVMYIYQTAFTKNNMGYACAMSIVFFLLLMILTQIQRKATAKAEEVC